MNGPEHYAEAEALLERATTRVEIGGHRFSYIADHEIAPVIAAQAHATLALAAATVAARTTWANPADDYSETHVDNNEAWAAVSQ